MTTAQIAPTGPSAITASASVALWRRWVGANAVGELLGLGLTGVAAAIAMVTIEPRWPLVAAGAVVATGTIEGTIVGLAQWRVLRDHLDLSARRWVTATVVGALAAWAAGVTPSLVLADADGVGVEPTLAMQLGLAAALGLVAGPVLGGPQAVALRGLVDRPWRWVAANAVAWACALPVTFLAPALAPAGSGAPVLAAGFAVGAFAAGAVAGAVHGVVVVSMAGGRGVEVINPVMHRLLRSCAGRLLPGLVLLELTGRRSGRPVRIVAGHVRDDGSEIVVAGAADTKRWWRNLIDPRPVTLWTGGVRRRGVGRVVTDEADLSRTLGAWHATRARSRPTVADVSAGRTAVVIIEVGREE
ncbi:MAG TPA: nitroreductase/quinone reductase family protein [Euzebyales bacterium]|nr:nitroreductase/quinone reductase family protein [Euzebyales bacterium]